MDVRFRDKVILICIFSFARFFCMTDVGDGLSIKVVPIYLTPLSLAPRWRTDIFVPIDRTNVLNA